MHKRFSRRTLVVGATGASLVRHNPAVTADSIPLVWEQILADGDLPPARWDHTLSASDREKQLLLFGGRDLSGQSFGDTWLFGRNETAWTPVEGVAPSARFGHAVATDQEAGVAYLFGGQAADLFYNDVWAFEFSTGTWSSIHDGSATAPVPRYGTSMVWTARKTLLVSHGFTFEGRFNDTWEFDPRTFAWTDRSPATSATRPLNRCLHEAIWDEETDAMLLYGGCSSGYGPCPQGDLWSFDPATAEWTELQAINSPSARSNPGMAYDTGRRQTILLGGLTESGYDGAVFSLQNSNEATWSPLTHSDIQPGARASHDLCITGPNLYLFGGYGDSGPLNDLWLARLDS